MKINFEQLKKDIIYQIECETDSYIVDELNSMKEKLEEAECLLINDKVNIVFIGEKGIGKTTSLCHFFNLTTSKKPTSKVRDALGNNEELIRMDELLTTGSGGTTLSEVIIVPDSKTYIEIEKMDDEKVVNMIELFCESIWNDNYSSGEIIDEKFVFPEEYSRGLKNLIGLKEEDLTQLCLESKSLAELKNTVLNLVNIENRDFKSAYCDEKMNLEQKRDFVKNTFSEINRVSRKDMSIPKTITIHIDGEMLESSIIGNVSRITDTRGLDSRGWEGREDIDNYLNKNKDTICIFVGGFNNPVTYPTAELVKNSLGDKSHLILLVNWKMGEPDNLQGQDGAVEDEQEGIRLKKKVAWNSLKNFGLKEDNILFYNPFCNRIKPKIFNKSELLTYQNNKNQFFDIIESVKINKRKKVINAIEAIDKDFAYLVQNRYTESDMQYIKTIYKEFSFLNQADHEVNINDYFDIFTQFISGWFPPTIHATNKLYGDWNNGNIYFTGNSAIKIYADKLFKNEVNKILNIINSQKEYKISAALRNVLNRWEEKIPEFYWSFRNKVGKDVQDHLAKQVFSPKSSSNVFWNTVFSRYGKGKGYTKDIVSIYKEELKNKEQIISIKELYLKVWKSDFVDKIEAMIYLEDMKKIYQK